MFVSSDEVRARYSARPLFARFDPRCFDDYLDAGLVPVRDDGVTLSYPKAWEVRIFETTPVDAWAFPPLLRVPTLVLRGGRTDTFLPGAAARFRTLCPSAVVEDLPGATHLLPMERPDEVAGRILEFV